MYRTAKREDMAVTEAPLYRDQGQQRATSRKAIANCLRSPGEASAARVESAGVQGGRLGGALHLSTISGDGQ
jgi:hypothetical protein